MLPSAFPSLLPSAFPSLSNCDISEFIGRAYHVRLALIPNACLKIEMFAGGKLYLGSNHAVCTEATMSSSEMSISDYKGVQGEAAVFEGFWSGSFVFNPNEDPDPLEVSLKSFSDISFSQQTFAADLATSSCVAPSGTPSFQPSLAPSAIHSPTPSALPSDMPSHTPSQYPTQLPSILPSSSPSQVPSFIPSRLPSSTPSIAPSSTPSLTLSDPPSNIPTLEPRCDVVELLGKTYYVRYPSLNGDLICLKIEFFSGGMLYLDPLNLSCTDSDSLSPVPISSYFAAHDKYIEFQPTGGQAWRGTFNFVTNSTELEFDTVSLNYDDLIFTAKTKIPSCTAPSASPSTIESASPSSFPSIHPSDIPSKNPSVIPTVLESDIPSVVPSQVPTPVCNVEDPNKVGNGQCDDEPGKLYYTVRCDWDGGDCDAIVAKYPNCPGPYGWLNDCVCDVALNTADCGWDDGDCLPGGTDNCEQRS